MIRMLGRLLDSMYCTTLHTFSIRMSHKFRYIVVIVDVPTRLQSQVSSTTDSAMAAPLLSPSLFRWWTSMCLFFLELLGTCIQAGYTITGLVLAATLWDAFFMTTGYFAYTPFADRSYVEFTMTCGGFCALRQPVLQVSAVPFELHLTTRPPPTRTAVYPDHTWTVLTDVHTLISTL